MNDTSTMVAGYLKGLDSSAAELPECYEHASAAFKHGWLNGRDDRVSNPRDRAEVLQRRASMILNQDAI